MPDTILPRLLVFPRREITSLKTDPPPDDLEVFPLLPGREAFDQEYETDAHLAMYVLGNVAGGICSETSSPRISKNKAGLAWLKKQGLEPLMRWVVLDVDTPEHRPWAETPAAWWVGQLSAIKSSPEASRAGWYRTRAGYHLVWALDPGLTPGDWERYVAALRARLRRDGIHINDECKDWTRLMRLPRVTRDGEPQDLPWDLDSIRSLNLLAAPLPTPQKKDPAQDKPKLELVKPASAEGDDWSRVKVGQRLRDQLEAGKPFGNTKSRRIESMGEHGRDTQILSAAGALLSGMDEPDVETVVRLMLPSVMASRRDDPQEIGDEDALRARVRALWEKEMAGRPTKPPTTEPPPTDPFDGLEARTTDQSMPLVVASRTGRGYYVLDDRTGGYVGPHSPDHVAKAVLELCPSRGARAVGERGAPRDGTRIFHEDGAFADQIILRAGAEYSTFDRATGTLYEACARWAPIEPEYDEQIDRWLRLLGGDQAERLLDWLASSRRIDRPTCVLYLRGPKGIGKSMVWEGCSRLWLSHAAVPYETLSASFDGQLSESLLVVADEGMDDAGFSRRGSPSKIFRTAVTASQRTIRRKHLPDATMEACFRLVVTANDDEALNLQEQLSEESVEAIAERILYVSSGPEACEYLRSIGGREATETWVRGGRIARYILWLEQEREVRPGYRLLVEGDSATLAAKIAGRSGVNRHVMAVLSKYLDQYDDRRARTAADRVMGDLGPTYHPRIFLEDSDLWVNLEALHERWPLLHGDRERATRDALARALKTISRGRKHHRRVDGQPVWVYRIDGHEIVEHARMMGLGDDQAMLSRLDASTLPAPF